MNKDKFKVGDRVALVGMVDAVEGDGTPRVLWDDGTYARVFNRRLTLVSDLYPRPSWDDAPPDAVALAQDKIGHWFWYNQVPTQTGAVWTDGTLSRAHVRNPNWRESLELRPEPPVEEMTVEQVCKALGKQIKIVRG